MNAQKIAQYTRTDRYNNPCRPDVFNNVRLDWERIQAEVPAELRNPASCVVVYNVKRDTLEFPGYLDINFPAEIEAVAAQYRQWVTAFFS